MEKISVATLPATKNVQNIGVVHPYGSKRSFFGQPYGQYDIQNVEISILVGGKSLTY